MIIVFIKLGELHIWAIRWINIHSAYIHLELGELHQRFAGLYPPGESY